jgi:hypothetical protein
MSREPIYNREIVEVFLDLSSRNDKFDDLPQFTVERDAAFLSLYDLAHDEPEQFLEILIQIAGKCNDWHILNEFVSGPLEIFLTSHGEKYLDILIDKIRDNKNAKEMVFSAVSLVQLPEDMKQRILDCGEKRDNKG